MFILQILLVYIYNILYVISTSKLNVTSKVLCYKTHKQENFQISFRKRRKYLHFTQNRQLISLRWTAMDF